MSINDIHTAGGRKRSKANNIPIIAPAVPIIHFISSSFAYE